MSMRRHIARAFGGAPAAFQGLEVGVHRIHLEGEVPRQVRPRQAPTGLGGGGLAVGEKRDEEKNETKNETNS